MRIVNLSMAGLLIIIIAFTSISYASQEPDLKKIDDLMQQHEYSQALDQCNAGLVANPNNENLLYIRIVLYKFTNQPEKAVADFDKLINDAHNKAKKLSVMAYKNSYFGKFNEAKKLIDKAIKLDPNQPEFYADRAVILIDQSTNNATAALKDIDKALKLDPKFYSAYYARGRIYEKLGQKEKAEEEFAIAKKLKMQGFEEM